MPCMSTTITPTTTATTGGYSLPAGEGERLWVTGDTMTFKATGATTGGRLMLLENLTTPGGGPPPHIHVHDDEFFYVVDGTFEVLIGDETHALGPGGFAYIEHGTLHRFRNTADAPSRILIGFAPAGTEGFFRAAGRPALGDGQAPPLDEAEVARSVAVAGQYGLVVPGFTD